ncbi:hypothetical protein [Actinoplanes sp. NPDC026623]|uniref:hypothetical protein n=1 Tax=Actinoplanes sp. NPDC026623 TaxID=3155610 RepID=UPI0033E6D2E2
MSTDLKFGVGAVIELAEADYMYGTGTLALKVEWIGADLNAFPTLEWVILGGRELHPNGLGDPRETCARVSAIRDALRPDDWRPGLDWKG